MSEEEADWASPTVRAALYDSWPTPLGLWTLGLIGDVITAVTHRLPTARQCYHSRTPMKNHQVRFRYLLLTVAALILLGTLSAQAQSNLSFLGGNGGALELTIDAPIVYQIITAPVGQVPFFLFQNVGNVFMGGNPFPKNSGVTGSITFTINGGSPFVVNVAGSGFARNDTTTNDLYLYYGSFANVPALNVGDTLLLQSGTLTTTTNVAQAPPANGSYSTFVIDGDGTRRSTYGLATVPEPSTWTLLLIGACGSLWMIRRRDQAV